MSECLCVGEILFNYSAFFLGVIAECCSGHLCLYDLDKAEVVVTLKPQTDPVSNGSFVYSNLKVF